MFQLLPNNKELVLETVEQNGYALQFANKKFKNNKEIVLEAVKQNGIALYSASDEFKNDRDIVLEAVAQNDAALEYASDTLKKDRDLLHEANLLKLSNSLNKPFETHKGLRRHTDLFKNQEVLAKKYEKTTSIVKIKLTEL